jgi:hypothetical protein
MRHVGKHAACCNDVHPQEADFFPKGAPVAMISSKKARFPPKVAVCRIDSRRQEVILFLK